jgi:hypothetical protein
MNALRSAENSLRDPLSVYPNAADYLPRPGLVVVNGPTKCPIRRSITTQLRSESPVLAAVSVRALSRVQRRHTIGWAR